MDIAHSQAMNVDLAAGGAVVAGAAPALGGREGPLRLGVDELMHGCRRFVVVAPHPDDETLGVGGVLASVLRQRRAVVVIAVTDGESSHVRGDWWTPEILRSERPAESARALRQLGWKWPVIHRLQLPDGAVAAHELMLAQRLAGLLRKGDRVVTTWRHDGHPDHAATARAVLAVATRIGCAYAQFPVWARERALAGHGAPLHARRFDLDADALRKKRLALAAYRSQLEADPVSGMPPVVSGAMLRACLQPFEVLL